MGEKITESGGSGRFFVFQPSWRAKPDLWYPVLLMAAGILFFSDPLFSSKNFYFRDILNFHYPLRKVLIDAYARGEFPLWNPYIYLGQPMLANPNYMAFYPTNLLHLFLPFNYAFKLHFIMHPILGGVGLYLLQRRLGIDAMAAFGGSLAYQFSGVVLSFLNLYNIVPAVALIPWLGWAFVGALKGNPWVRSLGFGAIMALQAAAFEPLTFQCGLWLVFGLGLLHLVESKERWRAASLIARVGIVGAMFGFGVAAVQILPTLELIPRSARGIGYNFDIISYWSMHPIEFLNLFVPHLFGDPYTIDGSAYWGEIFHRGREGYLVSFFLGTAALLLSALSFLSPRRNLRRTMLGLIFLSVFMSAGEFNPFYRWISEHVPGISLGRFPCKYFLLATLALVVMASLGLEMLLLHKARVSRARKGVLAVVILGLICAALALGMHGYFRSQPRSLEAWIRSNADPQRAAVKNFPSIAAQLNHSLRASGIFLAISSILVFASRLWTDSRVSPVLLISVLAGEVIPANLRLVPLMPDRDVDFIPEVSTYLARHGPKELYRIVPLDSPSAFALEIWAPNRSWAWFTQFTRMSGQPMHGIISGLQYAVLYAVDDLNTQDSDDLYNRALILQGIDGLKFLGRMNSRVLLTISQIPYPGVKVMVLLPTNTPQKLKVYWLEDMLPRAYFVSGVEYTQSHKHALERLSQPGFPADREIILEGSGIDRKPDEEVEGIARVLSYHDRRVECEVDARKPGYVVLLDSYYPGWRAYLDGAEAKILHANYAFRAVEVPAGKHRVDFVYQPRSFYAGLSLTSFSLLIGVAALFWQPRRRSSRDME